MLVADYVHDVHTDCSVYLYVARASHSMSDAPIRIGSSEITL